MAERQLLELGPDSICLTAAGTEHALHIIRAHRLWERHLAEETGYREANGTAVPTSRSIGSPRPSSRRWPRG